MGKILHNRKTKIETIASKIMQYKIQWNKIFKVLKAGEKKHKGKKQIKKQTSSNNLIRKNVFQK